MRDTAGDLHALDGICPHEGAPLVYGELDEDLLVCALHAWCFDVTTGRSLNQPDCRLTHYHVEVQGDEVYVDRDRRAAGS